MLQFLQTVLSRMCLLRWLEEGAAAQGRRLWRWKNSQFPFCQLEGSTKASGVVSQYFKHHTWLFFVYKRNLMKNTTKGFSCRIALSLIACGRLWNNNYLYFRGISKLSLCCRSSGLLRAQGRLRPYGCCECLTDGIAKSFPMARITSGFSMSQNGS